MNAFRFPLQKVLELREKDELESARDLAEARREAEEARNAREDLDAIRRESQARLTIAHGAGGAVGHIQNLIYVIRRVEERVQAADVLCRAADEELVRRLRSYHEAFKRRRTIDQLRERKLDQWRSDEARQERKTMDEVALLRFGRGEPINSSGGKGP